MERIFQGSFKSSHYYTTEHTQGAFGEENTTTAAEVSLAVKNLMAAGCDEIRTEMPKSLESRRNSLADSFVSGGLVFCRVTEGWAWDSDKCMLSPILFIVYMSWIDI